MIFNQFERLLARRYLRAKRKEGFISVITGFAFTGIALGVATLIIVMSVMNGFRAELLSRILGISGHIGIVSAGGQPFNNYRQAVGEIDKAFRKQVEALDEYRFIDLESEMDVMRDMLKSDGLIDEDEQKDDDPFADVLKNRNDRNTPMGAH